MSEIGHKHPLYYQLVGVCCTPSLNMATMAARTLGHHCTPAVASRQQSCPLRPSSFRGSSVASCSYRAPQLSLQSRPRQQRVHAGAVYASAAAPWDNLPAARCDFTQVGDCWAGVIESL